MWCLEVSLLLHFSSLNAYPAAFVHLQAWIRNGGAERTLPIPDHPRGVCPLMSLPQAKYTKSVSPRESAKCMYLLLRNSHVSLACLPGRFPSGRLAGCPKSRCAGFWELPNCGGSTQLPLPNWVVAPSLQMSWRIPWCVVHRILWECALQVFLCAAL